jgi:hypothetical protein
VKGLADTAAAEHAAAQKAVTDLQAQVTAATTAYGPAAQNAQLSAAAAKLAADILAPKAAAAKQAAEAAAPLKTALDQATADLNAVKAEVEKWKAAVAAAATPAKKG